MERADNIEMLKQTVLGFSKLFGKDTEIVLYDLSIKEIVFIINGDITGRKVGYKLNSSVYETILRYADQDGHVIGYESHSSQGSSLRSSHLIVNDQSGKAIALICINQDISKWEEMRGMIDAMIQYQPIKDDTSETETDYIQRMTQKVIMESIKKMKPLGLESKDGKMEVLRQLELKGVFSVKDAVPIVCKNLAISQATLYNYLRELRNQDAVQTQSGLTL